MPVFSVSCFKLQKKIVDEITYMLMHFFGANPDIITKLYNGLHENKLQYSKALKW